MLTRSVSNASICLPQGEGNGIFIPMVILQVLVFDVLVFTACVYIYLIWHEDDVKWIEKEVESLKALQQDCEKLLKQGEELELRARSFWHSELKLDQPLSEGEKLWVDSTKEVVNVAVDCITNYKNEARGFPYYYFVLLRPLSIHNVVLQIRVVKRKIKDHFEKNKEVAENIYHSMKTSRSKYRMLLGPENIQEDVEYEAAPPPKSSKPLTDLVTKRKYLISGVEERWYIYRLLLLKALLSDLSQLQLETETEKYWKAEAEKLIAEAEILIDKFLPRVSIFNKLWKWASGNIKPIFSWIRPMATIFLWIKPVAKIFIWIKPMVTILFWIKPMAIIFSWMKSIATMINKRHMKHVFTEFDKLLERKRRYGFDFNDRAADSLIFPSTCPNIDDSATTSAANDIWSMLEQNSNQVNEVKSLFDTLNGMRDELHKREETPWRIACLKLIECLYREADQILKSHNCVLELKHLEQIKDAVLCLQKTIDVCSVNPTSVDGFKNEIRNLVSKLTASGDNQSTLSIVGMAGIGKTALASEIFDKKTVAYHFSIRAWVQVSERVYKSKVLLMWKDGRRALLELKNVGDHLKQKHCLVILDDVSTKEKWDKLNQIFSGMNNASRILLTTRHKYVALHADRSGVHELRLQTKGESWSLFKMVTSGTKLDSDVEKLARKLVGRCGGLPLAILSLGCLVLAREVKKDHLLPALDEINQGQNQKPWQEVWSKFKGLRGTLKNCLYCFTLFPIDYEIPARRLVSIWVAEELVKDGFNVRKETAEDVAERYLEELRNCYMIQAVQLKSKGKIKTCRLPSMLREFIMRQSDQTSRDQYLERRIAYHVDDRGLDPNLASVFSKKEFPLSVLFFDKREGNKPGKHTWNVLSKGVTDNKFMEVRVLDLERVFRPQLPEAVSTLVNLKYLGLRWTYLEAIPSFLGKLQTLETLDVKHTCIRILPSSIWRLKKLRNLYLNQSYRCKLEGKLSGNNQECLQMLWGVFIDGSSPLLHELHRLKNVRKLKLAFQLTQKEEQKVLANGIVKLNQLQSLRLRSIDEMGKPQRLRLENMSGLEQLSSLHLFGNLKDGLRASLLPQSLTDLTLSASKLSNDPMQELQNLIKLQSLCLYAESYTGKNMACCSGKFQELRVLRLWKLEDLEKWNIEVGAMPNLMELEIRCCKELEFPDGLKHLKTLHTIKIPYMSEKFKEAVKANKQPFWDIIENVDD